MKSYLPEGYIWGPEDNYILDASKETQPNPDLYVMNPEAIVAEVRSDCGPCVQLWFPERREMTQRIYGEEFGFVSYITDPNLFDKARRILASVAFCRAEGISIPESLQADVPGRIP